MELIKRHLGAWSKLEMDLLVQPQALLLRFIFSTVALPHHHCSYSSEILHVQTKLQIL